MAQEEVQSTGIGKEISCRNCKAACCKGPRSMQLTAEEAARLRKVGTNLWKADNASAAHEVKEIYPLKIDLTRGIVYLDQVDESGPRAADAARYILLGECGNLRTDPSGWQYCGAYDQRPNDCVSLGVADTKCRVIRMFHDVDLITIPHDIPNDLRDMLG